MQRTYDGPACDLAHRLDREGQVSGGLAAWSIDQPQVCAVKQQTNGDARFPQEALKAGLGAGVPVTAILLLSGIEVSPGRDLLDERNPSARLVRIGHGICRP